MQAEKTLNTIIYAARIGEIGRFTGKTPIDFLAKYQKLLERYFDIDVLKGIFSGSEKFAEEAKLLNRALDLAHKESDASSGQKSNCKNLASVFSRLSQTDKLKDRSEFYRYEFKTEAPNNAFPCKTVSKQSYDNLIQGFYEELDALSKYPPKDEAAFNICFDRISRQYMWCITATDYEGEDISLYDYMKVSEAIMACLVKSENKDKPYTMVAGDFSGIQKYIFAIASANFENVTERLRARSFYVDIISRVFSQYVVDEFSVSRANILLQTGGKFYCLVPTGLDVDDKLERIRKEFDDHLYKAFHGEVSVNVAWLTCEDKNLVDYSATVVKVNELLGESKGNPFHAIIKNEDRWNPKAFVLIKDVAEKQVCKHCRIELIDKEHDTCIICNTQIRMGKRLPQTEFIAYEREEKAGAYQIFKDYYISLLTDLQSMDMEKVFLIEALNNKTIAGEIVALPLTRKYMANHIPTEDKRAKTFGEIANVAKGMNKLGVLKADVDVLGFLFAQGLRTSRRHFGTISRVNTMSRMLEAFFSGYVQHLLTNKDNEHYKDVYSVFSGGDDLFLLGPWDVMLDLAVDIRKEFKRFVADNDGVTMSAAVSIFGSREHIAYMAEYSEEQLDRAKNELIPDVYPDRTGRNAVCVLGQLYSWEDLEEQIKVSDSLAYMLSKGLVDAGILRRIMKYSELYKDFLCTKDVFKLIFEPMFYYDRQRNYRFNTYNSEDSNWFVNDYVKSMGNAADYKHIKKNLYFAESTIKIALNKTRRERN